MPPAGLVAGLIAGGFLILFWITRKDSRMPDQPKPTAPPEPKSTHKLPACEPPDDGLTQQYEWRGGHLYQKIREPDGSWVWRRDLRIERGLPMDGDTLAKIITWLIAAPGDKS